MISAQQEYTQHMTDPAQSLLKYSMAETIKIVKQTPTFARCAVLLGAFGYAVFTGLQLMNSLV